MTSKKTLKAYEDLIEALAPSGGVLVPMVPGVTGLAGVAGPVGARGPDGAVLPLELHNEIVAMFTSAILDRPHPLRSLFHWFGNRKQT
jgi:hypothetical protein